MSVSGRGWLPVLALLLAGSAVRAEAISAARAVELLPADGGCGPDAGVLEVLREGLRADPAAVRVAVELYEKTGDVVGVLPEEDMQGGYRGLIHLVPQLPVGPERRHLEWLAAALLELDPFFARLEAVAGTPVSYRWRELEVRFYRSVKKRTPAAFAVDWSISYNVNGTLNGSPGAVRDLLFHELFHLNDHAHHDWSGRALILGYVRIVEKCGTRLACLAPYAPDPLIVHGGTYYSFMPGNDVREYAADLALRYSREQREALAGRAVKHPFKCGPPENAAAWAALVREFFSGADAVPDCASPSR